MRRKRQPEYSFMQLIAGLLLGFFLGGGLVYLNYNRQSVSFLKSVFVEMDGTKTTYYAEEKLSQKKHKNINKTKENIGYGFDSLQVVENDINDGIIINMDEKAEKSILLNNTEVSKTSKSDSKSFTSLADNIHVLKDSLLKVKTIHLKFDRVGGSDTTRELDSLLGSTNYRKRNPHNIYYVEYWESPINLKAYKMTNNKIVLYGVDFIQATSFIIHNQQLFLKYINDFYPIEFTADYLPLDPLTDTDIINELKRTWQ